MKKVLIAPDSFKGCLSSREVALALSEGVRTVFPDARIITVPVADGGEGTVEALVSALGGRFESATVRDPLGRPVTAVWGKAGDTAIVEMASASGLPLLRDDERNPWNTSTYGTGELLRHALDAGCRRFLVGIGGSATNDGGTGMLEALGWRFLDAEGQVVPGGGSALERIVSVDDSRVPPDVRSAEWTVACDVDTPFCGPEGAAAVFAPQKGASPEMVVRLDRGMSSFARVVAAHTGVELAGLAGAGAAGGLGGAFAAFLHSRLMRGVEMVLEAVDFDAMLAGTDLVVTGEGRMDAQTAKGKLPSGVLAHAAAQGIPVVAVAGQVVPTPELSAMGFYAILESSTGLSLEEAMRQPVAEARLRQVFSSFLQNLQKSV